MCEWYKDSVSEARLEGGKVVNEMKMTTRREKECQESAAQANTATVSPQLQSTEIGPQASVVVSRDASLEAPIEFRLIRGKTATQAVWSIHLSS